MGVCPLPADASKAAYLKQKEAPGREIIAEASQGNDTERLWSHPQVAKQDLFSSRDMVAHDGQAAGPQMAMHF